MPKRRVRCVTLNLAGFKYDWFEAREQAVIAGLKRLEPDLVFFQEATVRSHSERYNQAARIGEAIGLNVSAFAPYGNPIEIMSHDRGGVALAARWPITYSENHRLPEGTMTATDNRVAVIARLETPWGPLHAVTTHLSWRPEEAEMRLVQGGILVDYLSHAGLCGPDAALIFGGDLNAEEREPVVQLLSERFQDCFRAVHPQDPGHTWNNVNPFTQMVVLPDRRLDYLFCPQGATVHAARVVLDTGEPTYASDHFGVMAEIEFPAA